MYWHAKNPESIAKAFGSDLKSGLTTSRASLSLEEYSFNEIKTVKSFSLFKSLYNQLKNPLSFVLIIAFLLTLYLSEFMDALVILIALCVNVFIGLRQEKKASDIFDKLKSAQKESATVLREGKKITIKTRDVVPGDIVFVESGFTVPADMRIIDATELQVNEKILTGEWLPVQKDGNVIKENEISVTDMKNMLWKGTVITAGVATGIVVATGSQTYFGSVVKDTYSTIETETPLQKNIKHLTHFLTFIILGIILLISIIGILHGIDVNSVLLVAIAVAVSAMPEALPATITFFLSYGMEQILKMGGLVKNLISAQTLGSVSLIFTDKTGTLTEGVMRVSNFLTPDLKDDRKKLLQYAILASDAFIEYSFGKPIVRGRPIEKAILEEGVRQNLFQDELFLKNKRVDFSRFDPDRRFAISLNKFENINKLIITGSPEHILKASNFYFDDTQKSVIDKKLRAKLLNELDKIASEGKRAIAIATKEYKKDKIEKTILKDVSPKNYVFYGFIIFEDSVREDVPHSISVAQNAGIKVIMLTGDHPQTAQAVALHTGIANKNTEIYTGSELTKLTDKEVQELIKRRAIFARVLPNQKLRIVRIAKGMEEIVAMTGDGINDAPALRAADIGIAVNSGTDVAKSAADLILLQNSFTTILKGVAEGRHIIDNIRKVVLFFLSTSFIEVILIAGSYIFMMPLPLLPRQLLWANVISESLMAFPFVFEPKEKNLLKRKPTDSNVMNLLTNSHKKFILFSTVLIGILFFVTFYIYLNLFEIEIVRTQMFVAITLISILTAFSFKSLSLPVWKTNLFSNKQMLFSVLASILILILVFLTPLKTVLGITNMQLDSIEFVLLLVASSILIIEFLKYVFLRQK